MDRQVIRNKDKPKQAIDFPEYEKSYVAKQYLEVFESVFR